MVRERGERKNAPYQLEDPMLPKAGGWTVTSQYIWYEQGFHNGARMGDNS